MNQVKMTKVLPLPTLHISTKFGPNHSWNYCTTVDLIFRSVDLAPPMVVSGSKQQAFLLLPNLVWIGVVGGNKWLRPTYRKSLLYASPGSVKICRSTFIRLCCHVCQWNPAGQDIEATMYPWVTSTNKIQLHDMCNQKIIQSEQNIAYSVSSIKNQ